MTAPPGEPDVVTLRHHQRLALDRLDQAWASGRTRAWVVLPPGAGKTLVGLVTAQRRTMRTVVLSPNTAIQGQWVDQARRIGLDAGDDRDLSRQVTSLTYQSLAVFEVDPDGPGEPGGPPSRRGRARGLDDLHANGKALVEAIRAAGPVLVVLDECHHLLEVWGRLLADVLEQLPDAVVLGLTATPPTVMTAPEAALVQELFGDTVFATSIPAVVREGDLAPYAELVWLTEPTPAEQDWLAASAVRFTELTTALTDPSFGSTGFLTWLDQRFVDRTAGASWDALAKAEPALCQAALRMSYAGLLAQPPGSVMSESVRRNPAPEDWVALLGDWIRHCLQQAPGNEEVLARITAGLPAVGYVLTRSGIRPGRTPVDRVLARSESKTTAAASIVAAERIALGEAMRMLVLCDNERASATLPADLDGVLDAQSGSAIAVLGALLRERDDVLLVTGTTVAGSAERLAALAATVAPSLADRLQVVPDGDVHRLEGAWDSRAWVPAVTRFFSSGGCHVLVGTRALLGEGWDARAISGLIDLTAVSTAGAVVQTRGRALRKDPDRPDKVALTWTVTCVAAGHPRGDNDWQRLVRKHTGFFGVDADGAVVDGVGHLDPAFSPYAPPPPAHFDAINARMQTRAQDRDAIRERWRVGAPYDDVATQVMRIRSTRPGSFGSSTARPVVVVAEDRVGVRDAGLRRRPWWGRLAWPAAVLAGVGAALVGSHPAIGGALVVPWAAALTADGVTLSRAGRRVLEAGSQPPSVARLACAVADGLHGAGLLGSFGADQVRVDVDEDPETGALYRVHVDGLGPETSQLFATALDDVLSPLVDPRYVIPRYVMPDRAGLLTRVRIARGWKTDPGGVVWHAVPAVLATNATRVKAFQSAWNDWIGGGDALYTGSPAGAGVLAAQRGADPFDVTTVMRREWR